MTAEDALLNLHAMLEKEPHQIGNLTKQILNIELKLRDAINNLKLQIKTHEKFFLITDDKERIKKLDNVMNALKNLRGVCNEILTLRREPSNMYGVVVVNVLQIMVKMTDIEIRIRNKAGTYTTEEATFDAGTMGAYFNGIVAELREIINKEQERAKEARKALAGVKS